MPTNTTPRNDDWTKYLVPEPESLSVPRHRGNIFSYGPQELGLRQNLVYAGSPLQFVLSNPQLFATGTTSKDEGYFYWGCLQEIGPEAAPGIQGVRWFYQSKRGGGSNRPGGSIIDFLFELPSGRLDYGVRIVTPWFHSQAGPGKQATDDQQRILLRRQGVHVVDIRSDRYITDNTGATVIMKVKQALEGRSDFGMTYTPSSYGI